MKDQGVPVGKKVIFKYTNPLADTLRGTHSHLPPSPPQPFPRLTRAPHQEGCPSFGRPTQMRAARTSSYHPPPASVTQHVPLGTRHLSSTHYRVEGAGEGQESGSHRTRGQCSRGANGPREAGEQAAPVWAGTHDSDLELPRGHTASRAFHKRGRSVIQERPQATHLR